MTEAERKEQFLALMAQAEQLFGVTFVSTVTARQYGSMIQIEPGQVGLALVEGWQPPEQPAEDKVK